MNYYRVTGLLLCYFMLSNINAQQILVPEWSKGVLWYQIFPERFCNGDVTNDPQLADIKGSWPHNDTAAWEISPWTSDWYAMQPWEKENGHKEPWFIAMECNPSKYRTLDGSVASIEKQIKR